jgi:hypothetical protein
METLIIDNYHFDREMVLPGFAGKEQRVQLLQPSSRPTGNTSTEACIGILFALYSLKKGVVLFNLLRNDAGTFRVRR